MKKIFEWLLVYFCCAIIIGCNKAPSNNTTDLPRQIPNQEMFGVQFNFTQKGILRSRMWAFKAEQQNETDPMILSGGVRTVFYDTSGTRTGFVWSKAAEIDETRNYYLAKGDVFVWSDSSQASLTTQTLRWDPQTRRIHTQDSVRIATEYDTLYGVGLIADEGLKFWEIMRPYGKSYREVKERKRNTDRR
ncbi:MAG: LPS export ABC transporter periplasmic protein LptC [bacterium]|nr:LPS export ABC transporter periplasmic protein LptC [bacterium]